MNTLVETPSTPPSNPRRIAMLIPLLLPSLSNHAINGTGIENEPNSSETSSSRPRGVILLIMTMPSGAGASNVVGDSNIGVSSLFENLFQSEEDRFQNILNHLMQSFQPRGPPPTSKGFLESLPIRKVDELIQKEALRCPVCLIEYEMEEEVTTLPCSHIFHPDCIKTWLKQANTCCVCRHELPIEENNEDETKNEESETSITEENENSDNIPDLSSFFEGILSAPSNQSENTESVSSNSESEIPELEDFNNDNNMTNFNFPFLRSNILSDLGINWDEIMNAQSSELNIQSSSSGDSNDLNTDADTNPSAEIFTPVTTTVAISTSNVVTPPVISPSAISTSIPIPNPIAISTPVVQTQNRELRMVDDDIPVPSPSSNRKGKGPLSWIRRQMTKLSCLRGNL